MRHHHQWRRTQAVVREVVLGEPGNRVAELVGHLRLLGDLAEHLRGRLARLARPHQIEYPELHRLASGRAWDGSVGRYFSGASTPAGSGARATFGLIERPVTGRIRPRPSAGRLLELGV